MKQSKLTKVYGIIMDIQSNYPDWPSTFSDCPMDGCYNGGRGGGPCAYCSANKLAHYIGRRLANELHTAIKDRAAIWHEIRDICDEVVS